MKMMTVDQEMFFNRAVRNAFHGECDVDWFRKKRDENYRWGVNWSCSGVQDVEAAQDFMAIMKNAVKLAEQMNAAGISGEVDYEAPDAYHFADEEAYDKALNGIVTMLQQGWAEEACKIMFK